MNTLPVAASILRRTTWRPRAGVHFATIGWGLPDLHDPDGHEVRFYTVEHHTEPADPMTVQDPRETAERHERDLQERSD